MNPSDAQTVPKRAFVRRDGLLLDTFELPSGKECTSEYPGSLLGESLSDDQRQLARTSAAKREDPSAGARVLAWEQEKDPETLNALLNGLVAGNIAAPMPLLKYLDDTRVRPALVDAARRARLHELGNIAQVVGIAGGPGACEVLRHRMAQLLAAPGTFDDHPFFNDAAGTAGTLAEGLLGLDADATDAAECIARLLEHPCAFNRHWAARHAAQAFRVRLKTVAMLRLKAILYPLLHSEDDDLFFSALDALKSMEPKATIERCIQLLNTENTEGFMSRAANFLAGLPRSSGVTPYLLDWLSQRHSLRMTLPIAETLGSVVPQETLLDLARRALADESPSQRMDALNLLKLLPGAVAAKLAQDALADEPDPGLKRKLEAASLKT